MIEIDSDNKVNPAITTLADLLDLAANSDSGFFTLKGEETDGTVQWSVFVCCNNSAGQVVDAIDAELKQLAEAGAGEHDQIDPVN